jgi:hypothetical protein
MPAIRIAITLAVFIGMGRPAAAFSGNSILEMCRTNPGLVAMYAAGISDAHDAAVNAFKLLRESAAGDQEADFLQSRTNLETVVVGHYCIPKGVTVGQVGDVFCKFLRENPVRRQYVAALLFSTAMTEAWPCSK